MLYYNDNKLLSLLNSIEDFKLLIIGQNPANSLKGDMVTYNTASSPYPSS